jgi:pimeloyl-ACP methyl ester carboxylesterase
VNALQFGSSSRLLFGVWDPTTRATRRGVVICPPWGAEYLRSHKACRRLAALLAGAGLHVMRFDYFGTGDSAGDTLEARPASFVDDARSAVEELCDLADLTQVSLVGLRLGATVALQAAARERCVDRVVCWDPVLDGATHLDELLTSYGRAPAAVADADGIVDAAGFALDARFRAECVALDAVSTASTLEVPVIALTSRPTPRLDALEQALAARGTPWVHERVEGAPAWLEERDFGTGAVPAALLDRIVHHLA